MLPKARGWLSYQLEKLKSRLSTCGTMTINVICFTTKCWRLIINLLQTDYQRDTNRGWTIKALTDCGMNGVWITKTLEKCAVNSGWMVKCLIYLWHFIFFFPRTAFLSLFFSPIPSFLLFFFLPILRYNLPSHSTNISCRKDNLDYKINTKGLFGKIEKLIT